MLHVRAEARLSPIHGQGLFLCEPVTRGQLLVRFSQSDEEDPAWLYINHALEANMVLVDSVDCYAIVDLEPGVELTLNYLHPDRVGGPGL